ncbi:MAG: hypothetical protein GXO63_03290 [Candidatus Micrarchaeota archaeon]|nr:hypothetical protein [Candidatus Micrarchaeota archaeon]
MKGVSVVIAVVMLLVISVSLVGVLYSWLSAMVTKTTSKGSEQVGTITSGILTQIRVDSVAGNRIYVRNLGNSKVSDFSAFIDGEPVEIVSSPVIEPKKIGEIVVNGTWFFHKGEGSHILSLSAGLTRVDSTLMVASDYNDNLCTLCPRTLANDNLTLYLDVENLPLWVNLTYSATDLEGGWYLAVNGREVVDSKEINSDKAANLGSGPDGASLTYVFPVPGDYFKTGKNRIDFFPKTPDGVTWNWVKATVFYIKRIY